MERRGDRRQTHRAHRQSAQRAQRTEIHSQKRQTRTQHRKEPKTPRMQKTAQRRTRKQQHVEETEHRASGRVTAGTAREACRRHGETANVDRQKQPRSRKQHARKHEEVGAPPHTDTQIHAQRDQTRRSMQGTARREDQHGAQRQPNPQAHHQEGGERRVETSSPCKESAQTQKHGDHQKEREARRIRHQCACKRP